MAENTYAQRYSADDSSTAGAFAFDTINSKDYGVSKLAFGAIGSVTYVSASDPLPVTISGVATAANQTTGNASLSSIDGKITACNTGAVVVSSMPTTTVTGTVAATQSGTWSVTNISGTVSLPTGASTLAEQQTQTTHLATIAGDTTAIETAVQLIDDAVVAVDAVGTSAKVIMQGAIRDDALSTLTPAEGDAVNLRTDSTGALWVNPGTVAVTGTFWQATQPVSIASAVPVTDNSGSLTVDDGGTSLTVDGTVAATQSGTWTVTGTGGTFPVTDSGSSLTVDAPVGTPVFVRLSDGSSAISTLPVSLASVPSHAVTNAGTFAVQVDGAALTALQLIDDGIATAGSAITSKGMAIAGTDGSLARILKVNTDGSLQIAPTASATFDVHLYDGLGNMLSTNTRGSVQALSVEIVDASGNQITSWQGNIAHDSADSGNPIKIGGRARSSDIAVVAENDRSDLVTSLVGKLLTLPYALPASTWSYAAASGGITDTTGVTAKAAAGAGIRNYVCRVAVINGHATVSTEVIIRDGAAGTVLWRGWAQAAGGGCAAVFDPPLRGSTNTLIQVENVTTGAATYFNLQGYEAAE